MGFIKKIINDTLKNNRGKWSRKSLTVYMSFVMAVMYTTASVILPIYDIKFEFIEVIFMGFLGSGTVGIAMTVYDKRNGIKQTDISVKKNDILESNTNNDIDNNINEWEGE